MYLACRHIKPGGERCKSPAMRGHAFCYFHARLHSTTKLDLSDKLALPVPEDYASIQESIGRVFRAIVSSRVDSKQTAQLLWALQIASHNLLRKPKKDPETVPSVTRNKEGVELAPVYRVCDPIRECKGCPRAETCDRYFDFDALVGNSDDKSRNADDDEDLDEEEEVPVGGISRREILEHDRLMRGDRENEKKEDDEEDGKSILGTMRILKRLNKTLNLDQ